MESLLILFIVFAGLRLFAAAKAKGASGARPLKTASAADKWPEVAQVSQPAAAAPQPVKAPLGSFGIPPLHPVEGVDPCHEELYEEESPIKAGSVAAEPPVKLNLAFDRQQLVQAVVMQEILTRPCQRQRRGCP